MRETRRHLARTFLAGVFIALAAPFATMYSVASENLEAGAAHPLLFGTREVRSATLTKFSKWTGVIARYESELHARRQKCRVSRVNTCALERWEGFLEDIADLPRREQIEKVNVYVNERVYIVDPVNYGIKDYWATPREFFDRDGDCEDYAISKYISLRALGMPVSDMRIVVLNDLNLKIAHAVLVVYLDGEALILDNQISQVINADRIRHYKPIYSINEKNWWLHRG
ncbi:MAG: transglutaminase-like cysteine peptidase [Alphaproteobacteria bacterium]